MMNMVRITAIRMVEEKKDGRNCWYDEMGEGEEGGVDDNASFTSILVVTVFSSTIGDFVTPKSLVFKLLLVKHKES